MNLSRLALLVPLFGLVELAGHFYFSHRAPTPEQWAAARPAVSAAYRPGDVVVIAPYWAEPVARWKFGDDLMPLREVARPDVSRYPRAIEVSAMGSDAPELRGWPLESETRAGKLTVRARRNPSAPRVTYDFVDHVKPPDAEVEVRRGAGSASCAFSANAPLESGGLFGSATYPSARFHCASEPAFMFVGVTVIDDERERPRQCVWQHPPNGDGETVTRFRRVPLGSVIRGHSGIGWMIERDRVGQPVTLRVLVDGEQMGESVHADGDGWKLFEVPLGTHANTTADVEIRTSTSNNSGRQICWEADSR